RRALRRHKEEVDMARPFPALARDDSREATLVAQAVAGDGQAFATLVEPHLDLLYRIAGRAAGNTALPGDVVQGVRRGHRGEARALVAPGGGPPLAARAVRRRRRRAAHARGVPGGG